MKGQNPAFGCRVPGKLSLEYIRRDTRVVSPSYSREYSFVYKKARDVWLWDVDGNKYLDCAAGIAVMNVGHTNPDVVKAIREQAGRGLHAGFPDFYAELPVRFCEELVKHMPDASMNKVFLSNSGTESVECAYKLARWHTKKKWFIAFDNCFHGRTMGSLSMTNSKPVQRERFGPFLPVKHTPYPNPYRWGDGHLGNGQSGGRDSDRHSSGRNRDVSPEQCSSEALALLEKAMRSTKGNLAGIMAEPIQGEGGYIVPPKNFFKGVKRLCEEHGALFCCDEVQAGAYRTGSFLSISNFGVTPDIVSMAKGIGGGVPIGATVASPKIMDWGPGSHSNTFGGNLLSCAGGIAALRYMDKHKLGENAKRVGAYLLSRLKRLEDDHCIIGDVRGIGLMIGVELVKNRDTKQPLSPNSLNIILCEAMKHGLLLLPCGKNSIRFCPPLTMTKQHADLAVLLLDAALTSCKKQDSARSGTQQ
ncbi:aminotransferase class III-fold pyridoxal phosphate-dependent enzyme [Candidatus Woesearchaeota archaeon]|nr:aminotransferase class III-fold pyridoxal phosphate-dependent enzyme [Candidatus Woesearchaeota archaeon]